MNRNRIVSLCNSYATSYRYFIFLTLLIEEKQILHGCQHHKEIIMPAPLNREHPVKRIKSLIKIYWMKKKKANISSLWRTLFFKANPTKDVTFEQESYLMLSSNVITHLRRMYTLSLRRIFAKLLFKSSFEYTSAQKSVKLSSYSVMYVQLLRYR